MRLSSAFHCKKVLWAFIIMALLAGGTMVNLGSATPATHLFVDPAEVRDVEPGGNFVINVNVTEAPLTYGWEISLSWDSALLELNEIKQGDFLHRWYWDEWDEKWYPLYPTTFAYADMSEANLNGQIKVGCTLQGDVPWATGNGWLCSLNFTVESAGACFLNLVNTKLFDHFWQGSPAPTLYPNVDGLFSNVAVCLTASLTEWKLKVNHAAGIGIGHKSEVGTANLLEAYANNTGAYDAYVQVMFEIMDSAGELVTIVSSDIVKLTPAESIILEGYWTADESGVYYITAYLLYGAIIDMIPDGFSRTQSLRVT